MAGVSEDEDDDCIPRGGGEDGGEVGLPATEAASLADALATARSLPPARRSSREVRPRPRHSPTPSPSTSRDKAPSAPPRVTAPLRVAPEDPQTCRLSDDLADSCKTLCKVCGQPFFLTGMRSHTQTAHGIQITRYKEIYGPFDIIEKVFHKCHICGKILLLDSDAMGGHIKGTHKMKEKEYKEKYCTYTRPSTNLKYSNSLKSNVSQKSLKPEKSTKSLPPVKALKASKSLKSVKSNKSLKSRESETEEEESDEDQEWLQRKKRRKVRAFDPFKDVEYDCAMPHCEPCGRSSVVVHLASLDNQELEEAVVQQEMEPSAEEAEKQQDRIEPNPELLEEGRETKEKPLCTKSMPRLIRACLAAEVLEPTFSSTDSEEGSMDVSGESSIDIDTSTDMGDSEEDEEKVVDDARKKMEEGEEESMKVKASDVDAEENVMEAVELVTTLAPLAVVERGATSRKRPSASSRREGKGPRKRRALVEAQAQLSLPRVARRKAVVVEREVQRKVGRRERERLVLRQVKEEVEERFPCGHGGTCGRQFTCAGPLVAHLTSHHGEAAVPCTFEGCSYSGGVEELVRHVRFKHTKERLFVCRECGKAVASYEAVLAHERQHRDAGLSYCLSCLVFHRAGAACRSCRAA